MSHYYSYLNSAKEILSAYKVEEPFSIFLKKFFSARKKYGSNDRKHIGHLCYCYFRLGKSMTDFSTEERILTGLFLCSNRSNEILAELKPAWNEKTGLSLSDKLSFLPYSLSIENIFPWKDELSEGIDQERLCESFFVQPDLFLRLRPNKENIVKKKLSDAGIDFKVISDSCIALSNASKIDKVIESDKEAVVQDHNSQQIVKFLQPITSNQQPATSKIWDCCAGSGGKSIMVYDINPEIDLTTSDIREYILINLKKRFAAAEIKKYESLIADLTSNQQPAISNYDFIICDVPCTGSGTWSRTPEQLYFFQKRKIDDYSLRQKKIISNIIPHLKRGGHLLYITCSVFKKENEEVVDYMNKQLKVDVLKMEILRGYDKKADTMFVALLKKSL